jgi:hypothetical protein
LIASTGSNETGATLGREVAIAAAAFVAMCLIVLVRRAQLLEPDDYAYRASIIALSQGHLLLSNAQYLALKLRLSDHGGPGIVQWVQLRSGNWVSEKNPGYPFFAVVFQWLRALRAAPLFYGAWGCAGLFYGARKWLGPWGGVYSVALYCFSGAALLFAWRATIPTFTDASLIAGAAGVLLGVLVSTHDSPRRRLVLGSLAFLALVGATFIRYSDIVELIVALVTVTALARVCRVRGIALLGWYGIVAAFGVLDLWINHTLYGGIFSTGYPSGLITFRWSAITPNVERMPSRLVESMPVSVVAIFAVVGICIWAWRARRTAPSLRAGSRRDAFVGLVLALGWIALWGPYSAYTWTVGQTIGSGIPFHVVRFYVPVLGLIVLLATWLLTRLPRWTSVALVTLLVGLALWSFVAPSNDIIVHERKAPATGTSVASTPSLTVPTTWR